LIDGLRRTLFVDQCGLMRGSRWQSHPEKIRISLCAGTHSYGRFLTSRYDALTNLIFRPFDCHRIIVSPNQHGGSGTATSCGVGRTRNHRRIPSQLPGHLRLAHSKPLLAQRKTSQLGPLWREPRLPFPACTLVGAYQPSSSSWEQSSRGLAIGIMNRERLPVPRGRTFDARRSAIET